MKVEIFTLCDFAKAEPNGKLYITGTFDHIYAAEEPIVYNQLIAIAALMRFERLEVGTRNFAVSFVDTDGIKVLPDITVQIPVQLLPEQTTATVQFVAVIQKVHLPKFGEYQIDLAVDSRLESSIPLYVQRVKKADVPQG